MNNLEAENRFSILDNLKKFFYQDIRQNWLSLITPSLTGTFSSMPRYILIIFPIFLVLGTIKSNPLKVFILTLFLALMSVSVILFTRGYWLS